MPPFLLASIVGRMALSLFVSAFYTCMLAGYTVTWLDIVHLFARVAVVERNAAHVRRTGRAVDLAMLVVFEAEGLAPLPKLLGMGFCSVVLVPRWSDTVYARPVRLDVVALAFALKSTVLAGAWAGMFGPGGWVHCAVAVVAIAYCAGLVRTSGRGVSDPSSTLESLSIGGLVDLVLGAKAHKLAAIEERLRRTLSSLPVTRFLSRRDYERRMVARATHRHLLTLRAARVDSIEG